MYLERHNFLAVASVYDEYAEVHILDEEWTEGIIFVDNLADLVFKYGWTIEGELK